MANSESLPELRWETRAPDQIKPGDRIRVTDTRSTFQPTLEGVVGMEPFLADPDDPDCRDWLMTLKLHPGDLGLRLVSTDLPIQVGYPEGA